MSDDATTRIPCMSHPELDWPHDEATPECAPGDPVAVAPDPNAPHCPECYHVPVEALTSEYWDDAALTEAMEEILAQFGELGWISQYDVQILWKGAGGKKLGTCRVATGLTRFYSQADWVIWIAADHVQARHFTPRQVQALIYHELKHCTLSGRDGDVPAVRDHDAEIFASEVEHFGLWRLELHPIAKAFQQLPLL